MNLSENTVLVTGGTRGIGLAIVRRLIELGNDVVIVGRSDESVSAAVETTGAADGFACPLEDPAARERLAAEVAARHPRLNVLINNAGIQHAMRFTDEAIPYPRIREEIAVNLTAPVELAALLLPVLAVQPAAAVVNVSSALALAPKESAPIYCATKAAIRSFSQALRYQLEGTSVRVMELMPPLVDTDMTRGRGGEKLSPEQVAEALVDGLRHDRDEVPVGLARRLQLLMRFAPGLARRKMRGA
jgi:short-subunit dehydrogenase involved in D-alanine esterification of teichoic acids